MSRKGLPQAMAMSTPDSRPAKLAHLIAIENRQSHLLQHIAQFSDFFGIDCVARGISSFVLQIASRVLLSFVAVILNLSSSS